MNGHGSVEDVKAAALLCDLRASPVVHAGVLYHRPSLSHVHAQHLRLPSPHEILAGADWTYDPRRFSSSSEQLTSEPAHPLPRPAFSPVPANAYLYPDTPLPPPPSTHNQPSSARYNPLPPPPLKPTPRETTAKRKRDPEPDLDTDPWHSRHPRPRHEEEEYFLPAPVSQPVQARAASPPRRGYLSMSALGVLEAPPPPPPALPHQSSSPRSNRYDPILSSTPVREYPSSSSRAVYDKEPPLYHLPAPTAAREFSSPLSFDFHRAESSIRGRSESRGGSAKKYTESARDDERYRRVEDEARRPPPIDLATYRERERLSVSSDRERPPVATERERLSISVDRESERLPLPTPTERSQDPLSHSLLTPRIAPPGDAYLFPQPAVSPFGPLGALGLSDVGKLRVSSRGRKVDSRTREERREGDGKREKAHDVRLEYASRGREVSREYESARGRSVSSVTPLVHPHPNRSVSSTHLARLTQPSPPLPPLPSLQTQPQSRHTSAVQGMSFASQPLAFGEISERGFGTQERVMERGFS
ncbi:hypothetical protein BDV93DRAFT_49100 [Ceratobasidium sp. AG-I]|nr:hypothetical protein BDV93DRAFT_49100 [Ceratobasidium sp. AG-I]